ncbi:MAG TPA: ATP-binding protein [Polyangia bacterium]|nr:ATP-binding protein [Polyangia bacterium]
MRSSRSAALSLRLALASAGTAVAVGVVCAVGLYSLDHAAADGSAAVARQLALIDDTAAMSAFQYQKGFVAEYLLTGNRAWLAELETSRPAFEQWLAQAHRAVSAGPSAEVLDDIQDEYAAYDRARRQAVSLYDAGKKDDAVAALESNHVRTQHLWALFRQFGSLAKSDAERKLADGRRKVRRLGRVLVTTSIGGALASLLVGFWWSRRITKPIYELAVQVESAAERTRIKVSPSRGGLEALGGHVRALVDKLEETDAELVEHRRRLVQTEKLSAIGELSAKLAHEILNPLAGMKAAIQLMTIEGETAGVNRGVLEVASALEREIRRVDGLVRRLINYSRPLTPQIEVVTISSLIESAVEASRRTLEALDVTVTTNEEPGLPPVEVDPLLIAQVLVNLLTNAAQSLMPRGGRVEVTARSVVVLGRREVSIEVVDRGPGIPEGVMPDLFKPFFTTKPEGHGLGLAVSQNIVLEHGGRIAAHNLPSEAGGGAVFQVQLPIVR